MLLIKTYLDKSSIHGIGVFADEFVNKGTLVWKFNPLIDIILTEEQLNELPEVTRKFVKVIAFSYPFEVDNYCMCLDHAQYMNHSNMPNVDNTKQATYGDIALLDIQKGTELTVDYYKEDHRTDESEFSGNG
jgi:hypothetical protein